MLHSTNRRRFLQYSASASLVMATPPSWCQAEVPMAEWNWHDPSQWGVEGRGFDDTKKYYDRLPARAEKTVRPAVWSLSRQAAGMSVRFNTDSTAIRVKYNLTNKRLAMPHMPATSVSGVDLYAKNDDGKWQWVSVLKPTKVKIEANIVSNLAPSLSGLREFMMYLPLYNGLTDLEIGVEPDAKFEPVSPRQEKPIVFYGTSIMHGACASRSGMSIPALIGRRFDRPTINLGFSGNGKMEAAVGEFLCELDPCVFAIDCAPNMNAELITKNCEPLVHQLRKSHPDTPILLVEDRVNTGAWIRKNGTARYDANHVALKQAFEKLIGENVKGLHYLAADDLLGTDGDGATDGSHPSDLGMVRYADAYEAALNQVL